MEISGFKTDTSAMQEDKNVVQLSFGRKKRKLHLFTLTLLIKPAFFPALYLKKNKQVIVSLKTLLTKVSILNPPKFIN